MGYEIDVLAVGEGEHSGDAICLRFGDLSGDPKKQTVVVIDGGFEDTGEKLVKFIPKYYHTDRVDLVVSTHPDNDHSSGLRVVLEKLVVGQLWLHLPWNHAKQIQDLFTGRRITAQGISRKLQRSLQVARDLAGLAEDNGIPIYEPFSDTLGTENPLCVLSPSQPYYEELLPSFRGLQGEAAAPVQSTRFAELFRAGVEKAKNVAENWGLETLSEPPVDATSPENNSSVILLLQYDNNRCLFTADAGVPALNRAADFAANHAIDLKTVSWYHIPHHGSRRNAGPSILDRIVGSKKPAQTYDKTAFVSASPDGAPKHPAKKVVNAYERRGVQVYATQGVNMRHHHNAPNRDDYSAAKPLPLYSEVDE